MNAFKASEEPDHRPVFRDGSPVESATEPGSYVIGADEVTENLRDIASWEWDFRTKTISAWSTNACRILGQAQGVLHGHFDKYVAQIHPEDRDRMLQHYNSALGGADSGDRYEVDYRVVRGDGRIIWIHETAHLIRDHDGSPRKQVGFIQDVTRFRVHGKSSPPTETTQRERESDHEDAAPLTVLVVDDDEGLRLMASHALASAGYQVEEATNGREAVACITERAFDAVLLDVVMPEMDGFEVCATVRALANRKHTPIVITTALDDVESIERAYEVGATDFIMKPINHALLSHRLRYVMRSHTTATALRRSESLLANAQRLAKLGQWRLDAESNRLSWSMEAARLLRREHGTLPRDLHGLQKIVHPHDWEALSSSMHAILSSGESLALEHRLLCGDATERIFYVEAEARTDPSGKVLEITSALQDITDRKNAEQRIHQLQHFDSLTGLPNRLSLRQHLTYAIERAKRTSVSISLLSMGIDNFALINDSLGRSVGDVVLKELVQRLLKCLRKSDCVARLDVPGQPSSSDQQVDTTLARLDGDEFMVALSDQRRVEDAGTVARRILQALEQPFTVGPHTITLTMSIGIISFPENGDDVDSLLQNADAAMHHAKDRGRNNYLFFSEEINQRASERLQMENDLRRALANDEFSLYYQPKVDGATGRVLGAEALIRWFHPTRGMVPPLNFIGIAEEAGLIEDIGAWVLETACRQNRQWQESGLAAIPVAVNLSARQLSSDHVVSVVRAALSSSLLEPKYLELELTESMLLEHSSSSIQLLHDLKALGVSLALDDFGTGYSSMTYLKSFPIDTIKIDRSFVTNVDTESESAAIVRAIIGLTHGLHLRAVAEGVETQAEWQFLKRHRCDEIQGYYFGRPVSAAEFELHLSDPAKAS